MAEKFRNPGLLVHTNNAAPTPVVLGEKAAELKALNVLAKKSGSNIGILTRLIRTVGDVSIYAVNYGGVEIEAALAGLQYIETNVAITLSKSDVGYSITSTPTPAVGKITTVNLDDAGDFNGSVQLDLYPNGGLLHKGTSSYNYSSYEPTSLSNVTAYSVIPELVKDESVKEGIWVDVFKRQGTFFFKSAFVPSGNTTCPAQIQSGSGDTYTADIYVDGLGADTDPISEQVTQLDIASGETIPSGTWVMASKAKDGVWYMQVPIWL